jgi:endonuclease/exonuclease/phosphatase (EEP) superfamily protein YafD
MLVELAKANPDIPSILGGDLNAVPDSEPLKILSSAWQAANAGKELPTMPANNPRRQIDYILFRPANRWKVVEVRVPDEPLASDHRPLVAVLELQP